MNYLTKYNISNEEIENIKRVLEVSDVNMDIFVYEEYKITRILDLFYEMGVNNIYDIIIYNPYMFYDTVSSIKDKIDSYQDKGELVKLINDDVSNLELIDLD